MVAFPPCTTLLREGDSILRFCVVKCSTVPRRMQCLASLKDGIQRGMLSSF